MPNDHDDGFLSRWARRKALARRGAVVDAPPPAVPAAAEMTKVRPTPPAPATPDELSTPVDTANTAHDPRHPPAEPAPAQPPPPPTLDDARSLTPASDFRRFVAADVSPEVRNTALKTLWSDPAYNVMDGLDIYIDDYGRPDPLPLSVLRKMAQAKFMNLFDDEPATENPTAHTAAPGPGEAATDTAPPPDPATSDTGIDAAPAPPTDTATETAAPDEDPDLRLQPHDAPGPEGTEPGAEPDAGRKR